MSEFADLFTQEDYQNDFALLTAELLTLAYKMLDCIPPEKLERHGFKNSLDELSQRYRHALKTTSSIPIPKKLKPAMHRFGNEIIKELEPFLKSLKDHDPDTDQ